MLVLLSSLTKVVVIQLPLEAAACAPVIIKGITMVDTIQML